MLARAAARALSAAKAAAPAAAPLRHQMLRPLSTVADKTVKVTFIDLQGVRRTVPGLEGQNLLDVARMHHIELDGACNGGGRPKYIRRTDQFLEDEYGAGVMCNTCHVMIPPQFFNKIEAPMEDEREELEDIQDDLYEQSASRLACQVKLSKALDGMIVYIPDGPPVHD